MMPEFWDFVLEIDGRLVTPGLGGYWSIEIRQLGAPNNIDGKYILTVSQDRRLQFARLHGIPPGTDFLAEHLVDPLVWDIDTNHIQLIAKGYEFAVYVNEVPAIYARDDNGYPQQDAPYSYRLSLGARGSSLEVRWDNLRVWDISDL